MNKYVLSICPFCKEEFEFNPLNGYEIFLSNLGKNRRYRGYICIQCAIKLAGEEILY